MLFGYVLFDIECRHSKCSKVLLFTIVFEYSLNYTPIRNGNDYDLIQNIEKLYWEKRLCGQTQKGIGKIP